MQIRRETAALLGYRGTASGLFEPETNVYYSVAYLAGAWRRANGDLCRALMKYRAGHGEERMSAFSIEYCRRARSYLASTGSPLGEASLPPISAGESDSRKVGNCRAKRPAGCGGSHPGLQHASNSASTGAGENEKRFGRSGESCGRTECAPRRKGKRTRGSRPVCGKAGNCRAKRPAGCGGRHFGLPRASTSASAGAGENEERFGRSGEIRGRTECAPRRKGKRTRGSRPVCGKAGNCRAKRPAGCGGGHFGLPRASTSASAGAGENEERFGLIRSSRDYRPAMAIG